MPNHDEPEWIEKHDVVTSRSGSPPAGEVSKQSSHVGQPGTSYSGQRGNRGLWRGPIRQPRGADLDVEALANWFHQTRHDLCQKDLCPEDEIRAPFDPSPHGAGHSSQAVSVFEKRR